MAMLHLIKMYKIVGTLSLRHFQKMCKLMAIPVSSISNVYSQYPPDAGTEQ